MAIANERLKILRVFFISLSRFAVFIEDLSAKSAVKTEAGTLNLNHLPFCNGAWPAVLIESLWSAFKVAMLFPRNEVQSFNNNPLRIGIRISRPVSYYTAVLVYTE